MRGTQHALRLRVGGARHFRDLIVWQLADQLRGEVFQLTTRPRLRHDWKVRQQLDDAADSVCRNIAEGFGCGTNREFARFLRIARRSLNEVQDGFFSARRRNYLSDVDLEPARRLQRRLYPAIAALLAHLDRDDPPSRRR